MLTEAYEGNSWVDSVRETPNPFGHGHSTGRIVRRAADAFGVARAFFSFDMGEGEGPLVSK
jgi:hypothetical protein